MDATMIARVMATVPERTPWEHRGSTFIAHDG